jgi:4-oxalocrotonate tautomerase
MPLVQITFLEGRDMEAKRALIARATDAVVDTFGVDRAQVRVALYELPSEHWGVAGEAKKAPSKP